MKWVFHRWDSVGSATTVGAERRLRDMSSRPAPSSYGPHQIVARTREVAAHHRNPEKPGRPVRLLVGGGLTALAFLALTLFVIYETYWELALDAGDGFWIAFGLMCGYAAGVFVFAYGYELYDVRRAITLTVIVVAITVLAVVIIAALMVLLRKGDGFSLGGSSGGSARATDVPIPHMASGGRVELAKPRPAQRSSDEPDETFDPSVIAGLEEARLDPTIEAELGRDRHDWLTWRQY
jgi:hypothetical protein